MSVPLMTAKPSRWGEPMRFQLTELEAYDALCVFLGAYWKRGGKSGGDIAILLGDLDRRTWADGIPADPAQWNDWLSAIETVVKRSGAAN